MTEEELERAIAEKYGEDWKIEDLDDNDEIVKAYFQILAEAID